MYAQLHRHTLTLTHTYIQVSC